MGLDTDIVKFNKTDFDELSGDDRKVGYLDGRGLYQELYYYRKHYSIQDILVHVVFRGMEQCTFHELTKKQLERSVKLATRLKRSRDDRWKEDELNLLIQDINVILAETDFNTSVISLSWIS